MPKLFEEAAAFRGE